MSLTDFVNNSEWRQALADLNSDDDIRRTIIKQHFTHESLIQLQNNLLQSLNAPRKDNLTSEETWDECYTASLLHDVLLETKENTLDYVYCGDPQNSTRNPSTRQLTDSFAILYAKAKHMVENIDAIDESMEIIPILKQWSSLMKNQPVDWSKAAPIPVKLLWDDRNAASNSSTSDLDNQERVRRLSRCVLEIFVLSNLERGVMVMPAFGLMEGVDPKAWEPLFHTGMAHSFLRMAKLHPDLAIAIINHPGLKPLPAKDQLIVARSIDSLPGLAAWVERGWTVAQDKALFKDILLSRTDVNWEQGAPEMFKYFNMSE
jgi:hypothetical protein